MKNKFKIISYIKWPDGTYNAPGDFRLLTGDYTRIIDYYTTLVPKYCSMHGYAYEFRLIDDPDLQDIKDKLTEDWYLLDSSTITANTNAIVLYKIKYVKLVLERNEDEYVVFFDADAIPSNPNIKLEEFIDEEHEFFVSPGNKYVDYISATNKFIPVLTDILINKNNLLDMFCTLPTAVVDKISNDNKIDILAKFDQFIKIFAGFNEGFFIVKNTAKMKKLFELCCNNYLIGIHRRFNSSADGHLFYYFLTSKYFYDSLKFMDYRCMGHHLGYNKYHYNEDTTFLLHDSDIINMKDRTKLFEIMIHNKWWTPILNNNKDDIYLIIIKYTSLKNNNNLINLIKMEQKMLANKDVYITIETFYSNKHNTEFLEYMKDIEYNAWNGLPVDKIIYI